MMIVLADKFVMTPEAMQILERAGNVVWAAEKTESALISKVEGACVIAAEYNRITERVIDAAKDTLKGVVAYGVGYNHIDVSAASKRGIYVANCRGSNAEAVAELAISLMLSLCRGVNVADRFVRGHRWRSDQSAKLPPVLLKATELQGKTLGLVGMGEVGKRVTRIARGFEMQVRVYDPYLSNDLIKQLGAEPVDFPTLMKDSDYISVHAPLSDKTRGLVDERAIGLMKPGAYLINTARGPIVDEKALITALRKRKIAGAGLDVFKTEPLSRTSPLLKLDNVLLTPHIAGHTQEGDAGMSRMTADECVRIVRGEIPLNLVNREELVSMGFRV